MRAGRVVAGPVVVAVALVTGPACTPLRPVEQPAVVNEPATEDHAPSHAPSEALASAPYGIPGDPRTPDDILGSTAGSRSVRIGRFGELRAACGGEVLAPGTGKRPWLPMFGVMRVRAIDESTGCAQIATHVSVYWGGHRGDIELSAWVDMDDLATVTTHRTRLARDPAPPFADGVHGLWLWPGVEVERTGAADDWVEVRTVTAKSEYRGFVPKTDVGVVFDALVLERFTTLDDDGPQIVRTRDDRPVLVRYHPGGPGLVEISRGIPLSLTDSHIELYSVDDNDSVVVIGFVPRERMTEPHVEEVDVWGDLSVSGPDEPPGADELDLPPGTRLRSEGGLDVAVTKDEVRLRRGSRPGSVIVSTSWGELHLQPAIPTNSKP